MTRVFLRSDDVRDLVTDQLGSDRGVVALDRLAGGSKKGVYRLRLDDGSTVILYTWAAGENYWPPSPTVPDDPFTDASGAELFVTNHAALTAAGVRVPRLLMSDRDGRYLAADVALVEDVGEVTLEELMERDPAAAAAPLSALGDALRGMHTTFGSQYGKLAAIARGEASQARSTEDIITDRALNYLGLAAERDARLAGAREPITDHVRELRGAVTAREAYALVHGELGPDHVFVTPGGEPVMIDIEGLAYFDVEWEHAFLQLRFGDAYPALRPVELDPSRLELYRYAQVLSLIEGPLRIADTDFPDRQWMLDLAEWNITKALAAI
jgi:hypothetical protein